jgi:hypothetical protein
MPRGVIGGTGIDASQFKEVARALKVAQPMLYKELGKNLRAAGQLIANDAKAIISKHSESVPPTIKVRRRGIGVVVEAGAINKGALAKQIFTSGYGTSASNKALGKAEATAEAGVNPLAGLFELGSKGNRSSATGVTFRHPVFGTDVWVDQEMHPFLAPAGKKNQARVDALVFEALDAVTEEIVHGFGGVSA